MLVTVKLVGGLVYTVGFSQRELDVEPGTTVGDIVDSLAIDPARPMIVARNGWAVEMSDEVQPGDRILVSPIFSGG
jgi:sulfur carrier protein ThiS